MEKRKVQVVLFYCDNNSQKHFLLFQMNKRRNEYWQNITGGVENDESFLDGAFREVFEESKISKDKIIKWTGPITTFHFIDQYHNKVTEEVFAFELKEAPPVVLDPSEHQSYTFVNEHDLKRSHVHYESNYEAILKVIKEC